MRELVAALLRDPERVGWESWLVALTTAIADEQGWLDAINSLSLDDQFVFVETLKFDDSIYSNALQVLTARNAVGILDDEVRDFLLADAVDATQGLANRLLRQRDEILALIGAAEARGRDGFDLAVEVSELEQKLQQLRKSEIGEEFEAMQRLDHEIHRLEAFRRGLDRYDGKARRAYRDDLDAQTESLAAQRNALEATVAESIARRDTQQRAVDVAAAQNDELASEVAKLEAEERSVMAYAESAKRNLSEGRSELLRLRGEIAELEREIENQPVRIIQVRRELEELRATPEARAHAHLSTQIGELYGLLPTDLSDVQFG